MSRFEEGSQRCGAAPACELPAADERASGQEREVPPLDASSGTDIAASMAYMACGTRWPRRRTPDRTSHSGRHDV